MVNRIRQIGLVPFLLVYLHSFPQSKICNLVFEGAGVRGIAYSGVIKELERQNLLNDVKRICGTSSGAITALLLSIGYSADEITFLVNNTPYQKFNDGRFFFVGGFNRVNKYYGWYRGQQFEKWLSHLIRNKIGDENITFIQLKEKGYKDLYVTGTCLNKQSLVVFSYENYPEMKIKDAVRISMSIPLYFEAVFIDSTGNIIQHPKNKSGLDIMLDGGFTANFPIKIFDSTKYIDANSPNSFAANPQTIGFRIDRSDQIRNDSEGKSLAPVEIHSLKQYFGAFYNMVIENLNRQTLTKEDWQRTVSISDWNIAPKVRKLPQEEVDTLIHNGMIGTKNYFSDRKSLQR
jgi:NTE family protein